MQAAGHPNTLILSIPQQEELFKIRVLEKQIKDLKAENFKLKVDNEEYRQQTNQLKAACKILTKDKGITTADKIPLEMDPIEYMKQWNKEHQKQ